MWSRPFRRNSFRDKTNATVGNKRNIYVYPRQPGVYVTCFSSLPPLPSSSLTHLARPYCRYARPPTESVLAESLPHHSQHRRDTMTATDTFNCRSGQHLVPFRVLQFLPLGLPAGILGDARKASLPAGPDDSGVLASLRPRRQGSLLSLSQDGPSPQCPPRPSALCGIPSRYGERRGKKIGRRR